MIIRPNMSRKTFINTSHIDISMNMILFMDVFNATFNNKSVFCDRQFCWWRIGAPLKTKQQVAYWHTLHVRGQVIIPTAHYSDSPLLRRPIIPTAHCSDSPFLRQPIIPSKMVKSSIIILKPVVFLLYLTEDWL